MAVTAGASAPENLVEDLIAFLKARGFDGMEEMHLKEEDVRFTLPHQLEPVAGRLTSITTQ